MPDKNEKKSRREFLRSIGRLTIIAGLSGAAVLLFKRERLILNDEQRCISQGLCRGCTIFEKCALPQALSARQAGLK